MNSTPQIVEFRNHRFRLAEASDVPQVRVLVNQAYRELADMGLNYTGTFQDEKTTFERLQSGRGYLLESEKQLIGTVLLKSHNEFTGRNSAYASQLAVSPPLKRKGYGSLLMDLCEDLARREGFASIQLDTAQPAQHLVGWYLRRGYQIVGAKQWEAKTYASWVFEKLL